MKAATIGRRLRAQRAQMGMTQEAMAKAAGIPIDTYKKYEGDQRVPGGEALAGLGRAGLNLAMLLIGAEDSPGPAASMQEPVATYRAVNLRTLVAATAAVEARMPRVDADSKARVIAACYELMAGKGSSDATVLKEFLDAIAGRASEPGRDSADLTWPAIDRRHGSRRKTDAK